MHRASVDMRRQYCLIARPAFLMRACLMALLCCSCTLEPLQPALDALQSDKHIVVEHTASFIGFRPRAHSTAVRTGFIFYPGGLVDERSYAELCRAIAAHGFYVVITAMPFRLAVFNPFAAEPILREHRFIRTWAIGGHSLGGAMAARYVYQDSTLYKGLILYASYPDASNDLSKRLIRVLSVSASLDGLATPALIEASKKYLPPPPLTRYVVLEGGNHAQFGNYGTQSRDNPATMSYEEQQRRTVDETVRFLRSLE
ncbi:MAG: alpha/beta hydrolase [Bacteroidota bacterium]|nr:alpha/beta hydrolase [Candidatus Kapabacteria bacterium]MDW8220318.1 alpha/beta hydrolase [Bacteroidota bacterium]